MSLVLNVEILGEFKKLTSATQGAQNSLSGLQKKVSGISRGIGRIVGTLGITLGFAGIIQGAKASVEAASDLEQQFGALDSIFKGNAAEMKKFSKEMNEIGLSSAEAARQSSLLGALLKGSGLNIENTTDKTKDLVRLAGDLAATFGGPTSEAVRAISSLLRGERDPIERYGVSLKQVDINAQMLKDAKNGLVFESDREAAIQATLTLLYEKTADAQGQAARESETYAGVTGALTAKFEDMQAQIGAALLPTLAEFSAWLQTPEGEAKLQEIVDGIVDIIEELVKLVAWIDSNKDWLVPMVVAIGTLTTAWNIATAAANTYKTAALLAAGAGVAGATAAGVGAGLAGVGAGAAVGGYMEGVTKGQQSKIYAGTGFQQGGKLFGDAFQQPKQNVTININKGNVTAKEIANAVNKGAKVGGAPILTGTALRKALR
jgi:hypothetical protein